MGIKPFIYIFFVLTIIAYFYEVHVDLANEDKKERPLVTFDTALMHMIDEKNVNRIVQASILSLYTNKEELYDAIIVDRSKDEKNENITDTVRANYLLKNGNFVTMQGDIKYNRSSSITLTTEELYYDMNKKVGYNNKPFELIYNQQRFTGNNIYFDANDNSFMAKNSHFELDIKNKDKNGSN